MRGDEMYDDVWNAINDAISAYMAQRNQLGPNEPNAATLDSIINTLENRRSIWAEHQVQQAISQLQDANAIQKLTNLTISLKQSTQNIQTVATALGTASQIISVITSITNLALSL
jgi:hypothetical protein